MVLDVVRWYKRKNLAIKTAKNQDIWLLRGPRHARYWRLEWILAISVDKNEGHLNHRLKKLVANRLLFTPLRGLLGRARKLVDKHDIVCLRHSEPVSADESSRKWCDIWKSVLGWVWRPGKGLHDIPFSCLENGVQWIKSVSNNHRSQ